MERDRDLGSARPQEVRIVQTDGTRRYAWRVPLRDVWDAPTREEGDR